MVDEEVHGKMTQRKMSRLFKQIDKKDREEEKKGAST
jgi:hypothetical protein